MGANILKLMLEGSATKLEMFGTKNVSVNSLKICETAAGDKNDPIRGARQRTTCRKPSMGKLTLCRQILVGCSENTLKLMVITYAAK